jgi:hypothetical protein
MADEDQDLTKYADKPGTAMHDAFVEWLKDETGYNPSAAKSKDEAFERGVILGAYLRPTYQRSEANMDRRGSVEKAAPKAKKASAAAAKPAKAAKKTAPAAEVAPSTTGTVRKATPKKARSTSAVVDTPF